MYCDDCVEVLYVYDVREMWLDWQDGGFYRHRDVFLVRQNIVKPLAAEPGLRPKIWESVEDLDDRISFSQRGLDPVGLKEIVTKQWQNKKSCWLVAFTEVVEEEVARELRGKGEINPDWQLLGYDICAGPSFLMNAGWGEDEAQLKDHLRPLLNEYHLFSDVETAKANWQSIHDREPRHGPFTIFGLYLIEELNTEKN